MELRKYYILSNENKKGYTNKVVFIVNIKSESAVFSELELKNRRTTNSIENKEDYKKEYKLYAKLFDYVLNLQTINILDYDTVLNGLLEYKKSCFRDLLAQSDVDNLIDIPGMQWIIRGQQIDIREIKNRLNRAFVIYETLLSRFPKKLKEINFEKCAVAAYITTSFEDEFCKTDDNAFEKLIELNILSKLSEETCKQKLSVDITNEKYINALIELIDAKLIDDDYRMYFYNYPKFSKIYSNDEVVVQKAILYNEECESLNDITQFVIESGSNIVEDSFKKLIQLRLRLPKAVITTENLFLEAIKYSYDLVLDMFKKLDTSDASIDKNISDIISILKYDKNRFIYNKRIIFDFCSCWENIFEEKNLVKLRDMICKQFSSEILWYKQLFLAPHSMVSIEELEYLSLNEGIDILNININNLSLYYVEYILNQFIKKSIVSEELSEKIKSFLMLSLNKFNVNDIIDYCIMYMSHTNQIVPEFENHVFNIINCDTDDIETDDDEEEIVPLERQRYIFEEYRKIINNIPVDKITSETIKNINSIDKFDSSYTYTLEVANLLYDNGYILKYVLVCIYNNYDVDFSDEAIISDFKLNSDWLAQHQDEFIDIRKEIIKHSNNLFEYNFCFEDKYPIVDKDEFALLIKRKGISKLNILNFFPSNTDVQCVSFITEYLNNGFINNNDAFNIIKNISKFSDKVIVVFFDSLDFVNSFLYYRFSHDKKVAIKNLFHIDLQLDTVEGKLKYMENTKFLDNEFDRSFDNSLDDETEREYVNVIKKRLAPSEITQTTVKNLVSMNHYYAFKKSDGVNDKFFKYKYYIHYVVSTTLSEKKFEMEIGERLELMWNTYIEILNSSSLSNTKSIMLESRPFLEEIRKRGCYNELNDEVFISLNLIQQDEGLLNEIFFRGESYAIRYLSSVNGFSNLESACKFLKLLENNTSVLQSDDVRENVYDKLVDPVLKRKYTRLRKLHGCNY